MANVGTAYLHIMPETKGIKSELTKAISGGATTAGKTAGLNIVGAIKGVIAGAGIAAFFKKALDYGGELQQSFGGLETIYGDAADGMKKMSYEAAQAGIDANTYAEQAVSFGAALRKAYDGDMVKAAQAADTAIMDMADNSAKMGTDIRDIQNAYAGFAKQNYTMLDNLKLGYGGTKTEMERLLKDAQALTGVKYDINNLGDVYDAIHAIQGDLGLTGVAAKEGATTFTGSMAAMKASAKNLLANMALGEDVKAPLKSLLTNTKNFLVGNLLPMVGNVLKSIPSLLVEGLETGLRKLPNLVNSAKVFLNRFANSIANGDGEALGKIAEVAKSIGRAFVFAFKYTDWKGLGSSIINLITTGFKTYGPILWDGVKSLASKAAEWFKSVNWGEIGRQAIQLIGDGIGTLGTWLGQGIKSLATKGTEFFKGINWEETGKNAVTAIGNGLKAFGSFVWDKIKEIATNASDKFKNGDVDWKEVGKSVIIFIGSGLRSIGNFIWGALKSIGNSAKEKFKAIDWKSLGTRVILLLYNGLKAIGSLIWNGLKDLGDKAVEKFKGIDWLQLGSDIINFIIDGIVAIGTTIGDKLKGFGDDAKTAFLNIDWKGLGSDLIDAIVSGITEFGQKVADTVKGVGKAAYKFFTGEDWEGAGEEVDEEIAGGVESNKGTTKQAMDSVVSTIKKTMEDGAAQAGISGTNTGAKYASGIGSGPNKHSATSAGSSLVGAAKDGIGDNGWAYSSGTHLSQNFIDGMLAKYEAMKAACIKIANNIKGILGFSVPKEGPMHHQDEWGGHFIDNMINGMVGGIPRLKQAATRVANAAVINPTGYNYAYAGAYGAGGATQAGGIVMNVTVNGAENPEAWASRFMTEAKLLSRAT